MIGDRCSYLYQLCASFPCPMLQVGKFSFMANSRARSVDDTEGMVKFIADAKTDKILGVTIMGPNAGAQLDLRVWSYRIGRFSCTNQSGEQVRLA